MRFRPCIDLHNGRVKQIVGGTLAGNTGRGPQTNFEADQPAEWFAALYRRDNLTGGHIIQLGPGNEAPARAALSAWPGGMQIGGGITIDNAGHWLDAGAQAVIVTSWVFHSGTLDRERLQALTQRIGRERLVLDLSCRRRGSDYFIVTDRWQTFTRECIRSALLEDLARYCSEYLIHAVDVEGLCRGIEMELLQILGQWQGVPVTYAGGIYRAEDLQAIEHIGQGRIDFTVGSALDLFGGSGLKYADLVRCYGDTPSGGADQSGHPIG